MGRLNSSEYLGGLNMFDRVRKPFSMASQDIHHDVDRASEYGYLPRVRKMLRSVRDGSVQRQIGPS